MTRPRPINQLTAVEFERMFGDEDDCRAYLLARRWPDGFRCPRCGNRVVYALPSRKWHWQCNKCAPSGGYRFSHTVGTIFTNSKKPLRDWFRVVHMMPVSVLKVRRVMGNSDRTCRTMVGKIRTALQRDWRHRRGFEYRPKRC